MREEERRLCEQIQRLQEENEKGAEEGEIQQDETEQYGKFKSLTREDFGMTCLVPAKKQALSMIF
nr:hypothetical protein [uncultured Schaedlerella sp.]